MSLKQQKLILLKHWLKNLSFLIFEGHTNIKKLQAQKMIQKIVFVREM